MPLLSPSLTLPPQLVVCTAVFTLVAAGGYCLFGSSTQANILNNLTPQRLAPIIGAPAGAALSFAVRLGYCTCLMVSGSAAAWGAGSTSPGHLATLSKHGPLAPLAAALRTLLPRALRLLQTIRMSFSRQIPSHTF